MNKEHIQKISTILLDMYGVIIEESKGNFIPYTYEHFNETEYERLTRQFKQEQLFTKAGNGEISSDMFLSLLGYEDTQYHMENYLKNYLTLDSTFIPFAEKFYKSVDFVLLSNDVSEWSAFITDYYKLDKYFKDKIVSGDVKRRKPDKQIFELTLERINKKPSECIFVDNSAVNLNVSNELGICPVLFNRDNVEYTGITVNTFEELAEILYNSLLLGAFT
ncbi:MAG: HAD-IA family hydrolase [Lachnospiraceae bacterium]|nr:HAD-IA family hydrolase [Lachnospiraceae bacterium]